MTRLTAITILALAIGSAAAPAPTARLQLTQRDLVPLCLDGQLVRSRTRHWEVPAGPVTLALSMRTERRPGREAADPGMAIVGFTSEAGHRYEVEVRADAVAFSTRQWTQGAWTPVVRDRTTDRIVSGEPQWTAAAPCRRGTPASPQPNSPSSRVTRSSS